jgi:hypothetical protein
MPRAGLVVHPDSSLADLSPLRRAAPGKATPIVVDEFQTKIETQLGREIGREHEAVGSHLSHLAGHLTHLHAEGQDRDPQLDKQAAVQALLDRQAAVANDLGQDQERLAATIPAVQCQAVERLLARPERLQILTRRLDSKERALIRDLCHRGATVDEISRQVFVARLLDSEPSGSGVNTALARQAAAAPRSQLSPLNGPQRLRWANDVAEAVAAHQLWLIFKDPFQH